MPPIEKNLKAILTDEIVRTVRSNEDSFRRYSAMTMIWPCVQTWFYHYAAYFYGLDKPDGGDKVVSDVVSQTLLRFKSRAVVDACDGDRGLLVSLAEALTLPAEYLAGAVYELTTVNNKKLTWTYEDGAILPLLLEMPDAHIDGTSEIPVSLKVNTEALSRTSVKLLRKSECNPSDVEDIREDIRLTFLPEFVQQIIIERSTNV